MLLLETQNSSYDSKNSDQNIHAILQSRFGLKTFRKGQLDIIKSVLNRKDALAVMPTGGGKSLCYQLPAVFFNNLVIVISPLIALMKDQVRLLNSIGIAAGHVHSGQSLAEKRKVFSDMNKGGAFVLYLSPERVQKPGFVDWIKKQNVSLFAIDEAHCVSQWGPDFREDFHKLGLLRKMKPDVPILALTATATPAVLKDVGYQLRLQKPDRHIHGFYRPNLFYQVETCLDDDYKFRFLKNAISKTPEGRILIYCGTRQNAETIAEQLSESFLGVGFYHAGLGAETRKEIQEKFDRNEMRILTATNAFGMGIDYPNVRLVVHYQMPANIESFYQEMGRAGRDGVMSRCLLLYSKKDKGLQSYFIQQSQAAHDVIQRRWDCLNAMTQFAESHECRHEGILTYFKDSERINSCGHCDVCAPTAIWVVEKPTLLSRGTFKEKSKLKKSSLPKKRNSFEIENSEAEARKILLKDWRREYAKEHDMPTFIVFSDRTLIDLANKNPSTLDELGTVFGFGPAKTELLGPIILQQLGHS
ncbi:MAG: RecQ family ATP-dependent DNA helicase [Bdellovibrionales bacterium]